MVKKAIISLVALIAAGTNCANAAVKGRVFVDTNQNGVYDKGEKLLGNVSVSDGWHVTRTNAAGEYTLDGFDGMRFVFITTPSGYMTKQGGYYRRFESDKNTYDFPVTPMPTGRIGKDGSHKFIQISDTEIFNEPDFTPWRDDLKDYISSTKPAFLVHTGDICYDRGLKAHIKIMNTENMGAPVFYMLGNHDLVKGKYGEELFESIYGPSWYSFDMGNTHYVVTPMAGGDYSPSYTDDQIARWLKNDLAQLKPGTPIIVFNHNLTSYNGNFGFGKDDRIDLGKYNLKAWLYGHWHNHYVQRQGNVLAIGTSPVNQGGIDHSTTAFRVLSVDSKGGVKSDLRYAYIAPRVRVVATKPTAKGNQICIVANAYSSTASTTNVKVTVSVDGKKVAQAALNQVTDWTWKKQIAIAPRYANRQIDIHSIATFANGNTATYDYKFTASAASAPTLTTNWTNLGGNAAHTGIAADTLSNALRLAWTTNVGTNIFMSSPVVWNGNIYVATVDENGGNKCAIVALDGKTGNIMWRNNVDYSIRNTIVVSSGHIFAQDISGVLYMVDAKDGKLIKRQKLNIDGLPVLDDGLATKDGIVYAGSGYALCAIDAKTGEQLWTGHGSRRGEGTVSTITVTDNNTLVQGAQWTGMFGINAKDGSLAWKNFGDGLRFCSASPSAHGSLLYTICDNSFYVLDGQTGDIAVQKPMDKTKMEVPSTPLVTSDAIVFGTADKGLVALDRKTLVEKWNVGTERTLVFTSPYTHPERGDQTVSTSPILSGNTIYFGASDGCLYGVNSKNGNVVFKADFGAPVFSSVAVSGNALVVNDFGGNVYVFTK